MDKKLKIGVFGVRRGQAFINAIGMIDEADVVAICDSDVEKAQEVVKMCPPDVKVFTDFDEMLDSGIDAVVLANFFHEHTPYAIRAMEKGVHVLSECIPAATLKECVELVEAVERTGCKYALAENYPFNRAAMEIARVYKSGLLGEVVFAEGEYVHPMSIEESKRYTRGPEHWRAHLPKTYYMTHSMAPLMVATDLMPKRVIGKVASGLAYAKSHESTRADGAGIMLVEMEGGSLFRISGSCSFGGHGNWYRLGCEKGGIESYRGTNDKVRLAMNEWDLTEDVASYAREAVYSPDITARGKKALSCGHSGGDYWVCWHFIQGLLGNEEIYMNVYRSAALAAVGILGWRSVLDDSAQKNIPDFTKKEDRDAVRDDDLCPFVRGDKPATLADTIYTL